MRLPRVDQIEFVDPAEIGVSVELRPGDPAQVALPSGIPADEFINSGLAPTGFVLTADGAGGADFDALPGLTKSLSGALALAVTGGGLASVANPEGALIIVTRLLVLISTGGTAGDFDAGIAADGTTLSDTLIDGADLTSAGLYDNLDDQGTNGNSKALWDDTEFLTISASNTPDTTNLVGAYYIEYLLA